MESTKNTNKKSIILIVVICLVVMGAVTAWAMMSHTQKANVVANSPYQQQENAIKSDQPLFTDQVISTSTPEGQALAAKRDAAVTLYDQYLNDGLKFKAQGDSGDKAAYAQAIIAFQNANRVSEYKFAVPIVNMANVYKVMGEYDKAESNYNQALVLTKYAEASIYLFKIDLYKNYLKKPAADIKALYEEALTKVVENANIYVSYADYLQSIGDWANSLKMYEVLVQKYPDNKTFTAEIIDLQAKLK